MAESFPPPFLINHAVLKIALLASQIMKCGINLMMGPPVKSNPRYSPREAPWCIKYSYLPLDISGTVCLC